MTEAPPTVLIIDNDEGLVTVLTIRLEALGYVCMTAASGAQGCAMGRGRVGASRRAATGCHRYE